MTRPTVSETNSKLGNLITGWSILAGSKFACPGESKLCRDRCYAKHGFFLMPSVRQSHMQNFEFSHDPTFADWMVSELRVRNTRIMRVHVSGDFYSPDYTEKWISVAKRLPQVTFFAYTRSWRVDGFMPELIKLGGLPNFQMWWSIDRETGPAPVIRGIRQAYMAINDADAMAAPNDCDLVFRAKRQTRMPKANGVTVCPVENGISPKIPLTCSKCGICWKTKTPKWETAFPPTANIPLADEVNYIATAGKSQTAKQSAM